MNNIYHLCILTLSLLVLFTSGTFASCTHTSCVCPPNAVQGEYCGDSSCPGIFECNPHGGICYYGPCTHGCCSIGNGKDFCCRDEACSACHGTVLPGH
ncbi:hypothetical protein F8M41_024074 [Gigaspora margarita]|uniref:Uncharacterized protein n=1 Tax=Gigaspora margarita TaxID=4874 RepID=A0A8H4ACD2_GIGMA|nr:hypothetical protein F8M41_024074 [Gigaspora margarita]